MDVSFKYPDWHEQFCDEVRRLIPLVRELFGIEPRPWQIRAWQQLLKGYDILVRAGTGMGKSLVFQAMIASKHKAIVLVISPLICLMEDQVAECKKYNEKIKAVALTAENIKANPALLDQVKNGEFQIVYASPEVLLDPNSRFQKDILGTKNEFKKNLVLTAVDECHCIYSWETFRPLYGHIGKLRLFFSNVPFALFSATLMPHVAGYVAKVCKLLQPTILFSLSIRRDNIKLLVIPIDDINNTKPLLNLLRHIRKDIPKTIIFVDSVEQASVLALRMKAAWEYAQGQEGFLKRIHSNNVIGGYWSEVDDRRKKKVMENFRNGTTRILIGTDAISLGVNVHDVDITIQWGMTNKVTIDILWQRVGRGGRGPGRQSYRLIFVERKYLEVVPGSWEAAFNKPAEAPRLVPTLDELDQLNLQPKTVPVSKGRDLARFTLPVREETMGEVVLHLDGLYKEADDIRNTFKEAMAESTGTHGKPVRAVQKLDPFGYWLCVSDGCLHRIIKVAFREPGNIFQENSSEDEFYDCDRCARAKDLDPRMPLPCGLTLGDTLAYQLKDPVPAELSKVVDDEPVRHGKMNAIRKKELQKFLMNWRNEKRSKYQLPSMIRPSMILPDFAISHIVKNVTRIVTAKQLRRSLESVKFDATSSLLSACDLLELLQDISNHLDSTEKENIQTASVTAAKPQKRPADENTSSSKSPLKRRKLNTTLLASVSTPTAPDTRAPVNPASLNPTGISSTHQYSTSPVVPQFTTISAKPQQGKRPADENTSSSKSPLKRRKLNTTLLASVSTPTAPDTRAPVNPASLNPTGISSTHRYPLSPVVGQLSTISDTPQQGKPKRRPSREPLQVIKNLHDLRQGSNKRHTVLPGWLNE